MLRLGIIIITIMIIFIFYRKDGLLSHGQMNGNFLTRKLFILGTFLSFPKFMFKIIRAEKVEFIWFKFTMLSENKSITPNLIDTKNFERKHIKNFEIKA